jgi:hypothetical protein
MAFMASASTAGFTDRQRAALDTLVRDLRTIFGPRLHSLVVYGLGTLDGDETHLRTLGLVDRVTFEDLARAVPLAAEWHRRGLGVPLLLSKHEFERTLDVFPLEYGNIIASHVVIVGDNPFTGTRVAEADRRRACEQQAKSHLIHLREGFLETEGEPRHLAQLIASSAPSFRALLTNLARLEGGDRLEAESDPQLLDRHALAAAIDRRVGIPASLIVEILSARADMGTVADPTALLARYIDASERIWRYVDGWRA